MDDAFHTYYARGTDSDLVEIFLGGAASGLACMPLYARPSTEITTS